jgi:hypothetical protein
VARNVKITQHSFTSNGSVKLFLISQEYNRTPGTYSSAVVTAFSEFEACRIHPTGAVLDPASPKRLFETWAPSNRVTAKLIGLAAPDYEEGQVITFSIRGGGIYG